MLLPVGDAQLHRGLGAGSLQYFDGAPEQTLYYTVLWRYMVAHPKYWNAQNKYGTMYLDDTHRADLMMMFLPTPGRRCTTGLGWAASLPLGSAHSAVQHGVCAPANVY